MKKVMLNENFKMYVVVNLLFDKKKVIMERCVIEM